MSRQAILNKIAEKLDEDTLLKLAADVLSEEDIMSLDPAPVTEPAWLTAVKEAAVANGAPAEFQEKLGEGFTDTVKNYAGQVHRGAKDIGSAALNAGKHVLNKPEGAFAVGKIPETRNLVNRVGDAASHLGNTIAANPGSTALLGVAGATALGGAHLLAKKMGLIGSQEPEQQKMASTSLTDEQLDKLASDPVVVGAMNTLLRNGLL